MHRALPPRWVQSAFSGGDRACIHEIAGYLCPTFTVSAAKRSYSVATRSRPQQRTRTVISHRNHHRRLHADSSSSSTTTTTTTTTTTASQHDAIAEEPPVHFVRRIPLQCHGCGAFSQTSEPEQAGFYDVNRKAVQKYMKAEEGEKKKPKSAEELQEDYVVDQALSKLDESTLAELGLDPKQLHYGEELDPTASFTPSSDTASTPLCDRCHNLVHHQTGTPIYHPTVDALRETIEESPFKYNHIYHVIDAADFPMSFIPKLYQLIGDVSLRRRNRRNRGRRFYGDRQFEMSFIITRADLLAPTEKQVNSLMPYLREVLRKALGEFGNVVTLGNLKCVSAQRGWWTKDLKQEIYKRGGGGWMVGKVNVGKSQLFEAVFPKGTTVDFPSSSANKLEVSMFAREEDGENIKYIVDGDASSSTPAERLQEIDMKEGEADPNEAERLHLDALLPPARQEINYPEMPTVSALPGTTASPIRIPYGNGKGELIDLPGLARSDLELFVKKEERKNMVMESRITPEQHTIKPKQSLLLGGLIRITPRTPGLVFLGYNFTPLPEHLTHTDKAVQFQEQTAMINRPSLATPEAGGKMAHAGTFQLKDDVTKIRAGPLTRRDAIGLSVDRLPFRVLSIDILIEGVGWVEITAQVRTRDLYGRQPRPQLEELGAPSSTPSPPGKENDAGQQGKKDDDVVEDPFAAMEAMIVDTSSSARRNRDKQREKREQAKKAEREDKPPEPNWPEIDVYSPLGKFVGSRAPMSGWMLNKPRVLKKHKRARPRKSMKGAKKAEKKARRAREALAAASA